MVRYRNRKTGQIIEREDVQAAFDRSSQWDRLDDLVAEDTGSKAPDPDEVVKNYLEPGSIPAGATVDDLASTFEGKHLEQLAEARDLPKSGTKAEIAERVIEHDNGLREAEAGGGSNPPSVEDSTGAGDGDGTGNGQGGGEEPVDLTKLGRDDLNAHAAKVGVKEPEKLQNKAAVIEAIEKASS